MSKPSSSQQQLPTPPQPDFLSDEIVYATPVSTVIPPNTDPEYERLTNNNNNEDLTAPLLATAVVFEENGIVPHQHQQQQQNNSISNSYYSEEEAIVLESYTDRKSSGNIRTQIESDLIHQGTYNGVRRNQDEAMEIKKGKVRALLDNDLETRKLKEANEISRERNMNFTFSRDLEKVTSAYDNPNNNGKINSKNNMEKEQEQICSSRGAGGYEVKEYETTEYKGMSYDTSYEYKSIYD